MRLGKFVEHFRAAAVAADAKTMDPVKRYLTVGRQLGYAGYLTLDNLTIVSLIDQEREGRDVGALVFEIGWGKGKGSIWMEG
jgi:hypothetical protein